MPGWGGAISRVLVRRRRPADAGTSSARRRSSRWRPAARSTRRTWDGRRCARRSRGMSVDLHDIAPTPERFVVTGSGVSALMLAAQMLVSPGDKVVMVTPIWPNIAEIPRILGGQVTRVPLTVRNGRWTLDVERLIAALTPDTRMVVINSPGNPTGWTIDPEDQRVGLRALPEARHLDRRGRCVRAAGLLATGRGGAVVPAAGGARGPADLGQQLLEGVEHDRLAGRLDRRARGADARFREGDRVQHVVRRRFRAAGGAGGARSGACGVRSTDAGRRSRAVAAAAARWLQALPDVEAPEGDGAMYAFFRVRGREDDMALAKGLVADVGLGLAPGSAFGPEGAGWLRWCFAVAAGADRGRARAAEALSRLGERRGEKLAQAHRLRSRRPRATRHRRPSSRRVRARANR